MHKTRTYVSWDAMLQRCTNVKHHKWKDYGGRGIRVCRRWHKFENFLADMGERPVGKTLDRKNNDGNYCKGNCRWATRSEQQRNKREYRKAANCSSHFKGVSWDKSKGLWVAYLIVRGKFEYLGGHVTESEAASAVLRAKRTRGIAIRYPEDM